MTLKGVARLLLGVLVGGAIVACGDVKPARPKEAKVAPEKTVSKGLNPGSRQQMEELFDLYAPKDDPKLNREQILRLMEKFSPSMGEFVGKVLRHEKQDLYTFGELMAVLEDRCATLAWLKKGPVETADDLAKTLRLVYPAAHDAMIAALADQMTRGWADQITDNDKAADLIRRGILASGAIHFQGSSQSLKFIEKMTRKTLWASIGTLAPTEATDADREIGRMLIGLRMEPVKADPPPAARSPRALHWQIFALLKSALSAEERESLSVEALEKMDWDLNESIAKGAGGAHGRAHFAAVFSRLSPSLDPQADGFDLQDAKALPLDLIVAQASDDLMEKCDLKADRPLTKEFLSVFLFRLSKTLSLKKSSPLNLDCAALTEAFHPGAMKYNWWRMRAAFEFPGGL